MSQPPISYKNHRFPRQVIAHAVWLYFRFPLSLRLLEEMLLERGIVVSYETVRRWGRKFGPVDVKQLHRKKPSRKDIWHLDEVVISIGGGSPFADQVAHAISFYKSVKNQVGDAEIVITGHSMGGDLAGDDCTTKNLLANFSTLSLLVTGPIEKL